MTLEQVTTLNNDWQGAYYPVPQTLSDSDSEKEIITKHQSNFKNKPEELPKSNCKKDSFVRHKVISKNKKMSHTRKFFFTFSILLCFLTPVVFVWVLPCPETSSCPLKVLNWDKQIDNVELFGKINNIKSGLWHSHSLAVLYKGDVQTKNKPNGVFAFTAYNGELAWHLDLATAYSLDCSLIDVSDDKVRDCIILSEEGIHMINPVTSAIIWQVKRNRFYNKNDFVIDFPVIMADLDEDNVDELLLTSNDNDYSVLTIISGKRGDLLAQIELGTCRSGHIVYSERYFIVYSCSKLDGMTFYYNITHPILINDLRGTHKSILQNKINFSYNSKNLTYFVNGHTLKYKNEGYCPNDCRVSISLIDKNSSKEIAAFSYTNSYLLEPVVFSFKSTESNLSLFKGHISGFVLKLWEWFDSSTYVKSYTIKVPSVDKQSHFFKSINETVEVNFIKERVMIITLNNTNLHVINASLTEIVQLCFPDSIPFVCQPNITAQGNSLLIEDLDFDGTKELVSYSSTFENMSNSKMQDNWKLVSNIKVIRLESELPKLYKTKK